MLSNSTKCCGHENCSRADSVTVLEAMRKMKANGTRKKIAGHDDGGDADDDTARVFHLGSRPLG